MLSFYITYNMAQVPLPLTGGWHPYFAYSTYQARVEFDPSTPWNIVELKVNMNNTGMAHLDSTAVRFVEMQFYDVEHKSVMPSKDAMLVFKI